MSSSADPSRVRIAERARAPGRALHVAGDGTLYAARGYTILRSRDGGVRWEADCVVPAPAARRAVAALRLGARLIRHDVYAFALLGDGARVLVVRDGVWRAGPGERVATRSFPLVRGSRPLNLGTGDGRVLFGEYGRNAERHEIHLYASDDGGNSFEVALTFAPGDVRHVHNVVYDPALGRYWIFVGDYGGEPGIGLLERDLSRVEWVARGDQRVRAVGAIVERDCLLYGTDTELQEGEIVRLDKESGRVDSLRRIPGTSLFAARFGDVRVVSTCVEPGTRDASARLFASRDGARWEEVDDRRKDAWSFRLFQFGTLVLPSGTGPRGIGMYSGQAVRGLDDRVRVVELS